MKENKKKKSKGRSLGLTLGIALVGIIFVAALIIDIIFYSDFFTRKKAEPAETAAVETLSPPETQITAAETETAEETTIAETTVPETEEPEVLLGTIKLVAYGDNLLHKKLVTDSENGDGTYDFDWIYKRIVPTVQAADIAIVNEECVLGGTELGISFYPNFNSPYEVADSLNRVGFNVVTMANNHTKDAGDQGITNEINYWKSHYPDITLTGAYITQEERDTVPIKEVNGYKFGFLNYTYDLNGHSVGNMYINLIDDDVIRADMARAREACDFIIVSMHWGDEYDQLPSDEQKRLANLLAEEGADIIIGTHPHVCQPVKLITTESGHECLVYYSIGNMVSLQEAMERLLCGVANVTLEYTNKGVRLGTWDMNYTVTQYSSGYRYGHIVPWEEYTRDMAAEHGVRSKDSSFTYDNLADTIVWLNNRSEYRYESIYQTQQTTE